MDRHARLFADARSRRTVVVLTVLVVCSLGLLSVLVRDLPWLTDPGRLRAFITGFGPLAPAVFILLQAVQVVVAPVPGQVLALASGWLFGTLWGTVYSLLGATIGSYVAFTLAHRYGRPFVERAVDSKALALFDGFSSSHGYLTLFLVFLVPGLPDDIICFLGGTTNLDRVKMTAVSAVGRVPGYFLANLAGDSVASARYVEAALVVVGLLAVSALVYVRRRSLLAVLFDAETDTI